MVYHLDLRHFGVFQSSPLCYSSGMLDKKSKYFLPIPCFPENKTGLIFFGMREVVSAGTDGSGSATTACPALYSTVYLPAAAMTQALSIPPSALPPYWHCCCRDTGARVLLRRWSCLWQAMRLFALVELLLEGHCEACHAGGATRACNGTTHHAASCCKQLHRHNEACGDRQWLHRCNELHSVLPRAAPLAQWVQLQLAAAAVGQWCKDVGAWEAWLRRS